MQYILLGFPKSGTMSFHQLFENMNMKSAHWEIPEGYVGELVYKARSENKKLLHYLDDYDAITQMDVCISPEINYWPQIDLVEELAEQYPSSTFILNTRSPAHILKSIKNWGNLYHRIIENQDFEGTDALTNDDKILNWINEHFIRVRQVFSDQSNFIEFDIEKDSIEKLRKPLNIPVDITEFPHVNASNQTIDQTNNLSWRKRWQRLTDKFWR